MHRLFYGSAGACVSWAADPNIAVNVWRVLLCLVVAAVAIGAALLMEHSR